MKPIFSKYRHYTLLLLTLCYLSYSANAQDYAILKIQGGYLKGAKEGQAWVFKGIPYAEAPKAALRFLPPVPKKNWPDTLNCTTFGEVSAQYNGNTKEVRGNEDCLSLNIYTPTLKKQPRLPVLVWVHGGSMTGGSGSGQNGHAFADKDSVVTITINYRLGVFGFLYLADVDPKYRSSGNNGLQDLMLSLRWIKENIASFGGDSNRVTVIGESAGAKLVSTLLLNKDAKDLFRQLILESGAIQCVRDSATAKSIRKRLLKELNLKKPEELLNLSTEQLITAQNAICKGAQGTNYFGPVADGQVISGDGYQYIRQNTDQSKRFLIGTNKAESRMFIDMDKRLQHPEPQALKDWFGKNGRLVWKNFKANEKQLGPDSAAKMVLTQYMYTMHSYRLADTLSQVNPNVWMYRFDYSKDGKGASHAAELPYVWLDPYAKNANMNYDLAALMHGYWVDFIHGKPIANWPNYLPQHKSIKIFDQITTVETPKAVFNDPKHPAACLVLR